MQIFPLNRILAIAFAGESFCGILCFAGMKGTCFGHLSAPHLPTTHFRLPASGVLLSSVILGGFEKLEKNILRGNSPFDSIDQIITFYIGSFSLSRSLSLSVSLCMCVCVKERNCRVCVGQKKSCRETGLRKLEN